MKLPVIVFSISALLMPFLLVSESQAVERSTVNLKTAEQFRSRRIPGFSLRSTKRRNSLTEVTRRKSVRKRPDISPSEKLVYGKNRNKNRVGSRVRSSVRTRVNTNRNKHLSKKTNTEKAARRLNRRKSYRSYKQVVRNRDFRKRVTGKEKREAYARRKLNLFVPTKSEDSTENEE